MKELDYNPHRPMPRGIAYCGDGPLKVVAKDLLKIAAYLQSILLYGPDRLFRYEDWWEHDGAHCKTGQTDLHELFTLFRSPRLIYESIHGDGDYFIGIGPKDESWYLRFYADWDHDDVEIVAAFAIVFKCDLVEGFRMEVVSELESNIREITATEYYERIVDGECSI
jgi:hypothetical protein